MSIESKPIRRSHLIVLGVFFVSFVVLSIWGRMWPTKSITIDGNELTVLVANTPERRFVGLGGRPSLGDYDGMLFLFDESQQYPFVMRDMEFSIDILWIDNGRIVDIAPEAIPEPGKPEEQLMRYYPRQPATTVLEVPAGWSATHGVVIGDYVSGF